MEAGKPKKTKRVRLTAKLIEETAPGAKTIILGDSEVPRFGVLITPNGAKSFIFAYTHQGRERRMTLGKFPEMKLTEARSKAAGLRGQAIRGGDPADEVREMREAPTVANVAKRFMAEHAAGLSASSRRNYTALFELYILKEFRHRKLADLGLPEVSRLYRSILKTAPYQANRTISLIASLWTFARQEGIVPSDAPSPTAGLSNRFREDRERGSAPTPEELARIGAYLRGEGEAIPARAFLFNILTGCRPAEAMALRWADVSGRVWSLPDSKTGPRLVYLGEPAAKLLESLPRMGPYAFPGRTSDRHISSLAYLWLKLKPACQLPERMRIYDVVRHLWITYAQILGIDGRRARHLVGHVVGGDVHERYVHLAPALLLKDADLVSSRLWEMLGAEALPEPSNVRSFPTSPAAPAAKKARAK